MLAFSSLTFVARFGWPGAQLPALIAALLGYGALIEATQYFIPGREAEWGDFAADVIGAGVGVLLPTAMRRFVAPPTMIE